MNKTDLIRALFHAAGMDREEAGRTVNAVFDAMAGALADGDRVEVRGFGSLTPRAYPGHLGRNPKTGEPLEVPPKRKPHFIPSRELAARVDRNGGPDGH